jgi:hypothetical protein
MLLVSLRKQLGIAGKQGAGKLVEKVKDVVASKTGELPGAVIQKVGEMALNKVSEKVGMKLAGKKRPAPTDEDEDVRTVVVRKVTPPKRRRRRVTTGGRSKRRGCKRKRKQPYDIFAD